MKQSYLQSLSRICLAVVMVMICFTAAKQVLLDQYDPDNQMRDMSLNIRLAADSEANNKYEPYFAYPPPAVVFWRLWGSLNHRVSALLWLLLVPASMIGCLLLCRSLLDFNQRAPSGIAIALACCGVWWYLKWDLRMLNVNSIYLLLVLLGCHGFLRNRPVAAGILLGLSVALKIYSIVLLPYFLWRRQHRLVLAAALTTASLFVVIPWLFFGWHDAVALTRDWIREIGSSSNPENVLANPSYKISLTWIVMLLLGPAEGGKFQLVAGSPAMIAWTIRLICLAWALLVAGYFLSTSTCKTDPRYKAPAFLLDISVLLICMFPVSPYLQPHHLVVLFLPALCLTHILLDPSFPGRVRVTSGMIVVFAVVLEECAPRRPLRGIGTLLALAAYLIGMWIVRCRFLAETAADPEPAQCSRMPVAERLEGGA